MIIQSSPTKKRYQQCWKTVTIGHFPRNSSLLQFLQILHYHSLFYFFDPSLSRDDPSSYYGIKINTFSRARQSSRDVIVKHSILKKNTKNKPKIPRLTLSSHASNHHDHDIENPEKKQILR